MPRTCSVDACDRTHRARGLCSMHWKQQHGKRTTYPIVCHTCGAAHQSARPDGKYCSDLCKGATYQRTRELVHVGPADLVTWLPKQHPAMRGTTPHKPRTWYAGNCGWCGDTFLDWQPAARYCSPACSKDYGRAKRGRFVVPRPIRLSIYERD